ncbi:MAG TPA: acyl carrier protein [Pirellulales bacterium]|nr:acyl carrier protein [Pirellulales bacterium]
MPQLSIPDIMAQLTDVFRDVFEDDSIEISPATTAGDIDGWDSLAHVRLIVAVERHFKLKFASRDVASLKTVGELAELIERRTSA